MAAVQNIAVISVSFHVMVLYMYTSGNYGQK